MISIVPISTRLTVISLSQSNRYHDCRETTRRQSTVDSDTHKYRELNDFRRSNIIEAFAQLYDRVNKRVHMIVLMCLVMISLRAWPVYTAQHSSI